LEQREPIHMIRLTAATEDRRRRGNPALLLPR
jgi:hypothetical protein